MNNMPPIETLPLAKAARSLSIPAKWLRDEVESGRLPGLLAGGAVLVHVPTVRRLLDERARAAGDTPEGGAA